MMILFCFGTRPEAIKCAPVILALRDKGHQVIVCVTQQHHDLVDPVLSFFGIEVDVRLDLPKDRPLGVFTGEALAQCDHVLHIHAPDRVVVQGDTVSTFLGAYGAFLRQIPVVHIEAGLRSFDVQHPFPEEMNRRLVSQLATYHFAPTAQAVQHLADEGINRHVYCVGNTAIDALLLGVKKCGYSDDFDTTNPVKQILVTLHRRENIGAPLEQVCKAIKQLLVQHDDVRVLWPLHPNPEVGPRIRALMPDHPRLQLCDPMTYPDMIRAMADSTLILTDSGGIQEEAPSLNKPVLVLRDVTERSEGIDAGCAMLVGLNGDRICLETKRLLQSPSAYRAMAEVNNPYGEGDAAVTIAELMTSLD